MTSSGPICLAIVFMCFRDSYYFALSQTSMSREFQNAKTQLFDTNSEIFPAVIKLFDNYENFEKWLDQHTCTAARAFDIRITTKIVKEVFMSLGSVVLTLILMALDKLFSD